MARFAIDYRESFSRTYVVEAESYDEAQEKLANAIMNGEVEAPDNCYDSGYNDSTFLIKRLFPEYLNDDNFLDVS